MQKRQQLLSCVHLLLCRQNCQVASVLSTPAALSATLSATFCLVYNYCLSFSTASYQVTPSWLHLLLFRQHCQLAFVLCIYTFCLFFSTARQLLSCLHCCLHPSYRVAFLLSAPAAFKSALPVVSVLSSGGQSYSYSVTKLLTQLLFVVTNNVFVIL